ncbi:MAG: OmpA family protein [Bacteroidota bacterium]
MADRALSVPVVPSDRKLEYLDEYGEVVASDPNANAFIYSYTDNVGTEEENQQVAYLRAAAVKRYLVGMGIAEDRLHIQDFITGANANDTSSEARAAQRRVDVLLE